MTATCNDVQHSTGVAAPVTGGSRRWQPFGNFPEFLGLPGSLRPPIWHETRRRAESRANGQARIAPPDGHGGGVMLIPGFMSGDDSLATLRQWLAGAGWKTYGSGLTNRACSERVTDQLDSTLDRITQDLAGPITLIGHSRGGQMAAVLAARNPDMVDQVVALASPLVDPFAMHLSVRLLAAACSGLSRLGVPGLVRDCPFAPCCQAFFDDMSGVAPRPLTSVYSRADGIIDWRSALHPDATLVEVDASHRGIVDNPHAWRALATILDPDVMNAASERS